MDGETQRSFNPFRKQLTEMDPTPSIADQTFSMGFDEMQLLQAVKLISETYGGNPSIPMKKNSSRFMKRFVALLG